MKVDNGWTKHVVNGVRYSAHHIDGATWLVKRYDDNENDAYYVECLFPTDATDELVVIQTAIQNNSWA